MRFTPHCALALGSVTLAAALVVPTAQATVAQASAPDPGGPESRIEILGTTLDLSITQGTATVNSDGSVSLGGTYSCNDPSDTRKARLRIDLTAQNDARGSISLSGPCRASNAPWNATVLPDPDSPLFARGVPVEAHATLTLDDPTGQTDERITVAQTLFAATDPVGAPNNYGGTALSGTYGCSHDSPTIDINAELADAFAAWEDAGIAILPVPWSAADSPWNITITPRGRQAAQGTWLPAGVRKAKADAARHSVQCQEDVITENNVR
ncbi:hypothetical protein E6W39_29540 [Kitasatospora acidiphila]|uniref:Uncharacterized protein n=1 Tax=Kitasatospora acidiphila TaxID=2567942 RepID=A0A540W9P4_9ACTN|nr:hypothetical protein [Kitasatospora acidiphila]TQF05617.1 hypothetical protein E6W39_29540 [Kitasatospora acidiphila]